MFDLFVFHDVLCKHICHNFIISISWCLICLFFSMSDVNTAKCIIIILIPWCFISLLSGCHIHRCTHHYHFNPLMFDFIMPQDVLYTPVNLIIIIISRSLSAFCFRIVCTQLWVTWLLKPFDMFDVCYRMSHTQLSVGSFFSGSLPRLSCHPSCFLSVTSTQTARLYAHLPYLQRWEVKLTYHYSICLQWWHSIWSHLIYVSWGERLT